jgi:hypothetical protein
MPIESGMEETRNLTLQKIGRNVVNFQKIEAMLRFILTVTNFSGPLPKAQSHLKRRSKNVRRQSMGKLAATAAKALHSDAPGTPPDVKEAWISLSFSLKDGGSRIEWRAAMRHVVKERNRLIHQMVASWNPHAVESCTALCEELDQQRERMIPAYKHLESVVSAIRESHRDLARAADEVVARRSR